MIIPVGQLEVIAYIPIQCPKHLWDLSIRPIRECLFYLSARNDDEISFREYVELMAKRHPKEEEKAQSEYKKFKKLTDEMRSDGGYKSEKADKPLTVYKGTRWLEDGHHRAAIICALFGPEYEVSVNELDKELPKDLNQCSNPCKA